MKQTRWILLLFVIVLALSLAACSDDDDAGNVPPAGSSPSPNAGQALVGNAGRGEELFTGQGCAGCHVTTTDQVIVGPALKNVANRAGSTVPDLDAAAYLRQSIIEPNAYVVSGFQPGTMPAYVNLPEADVNDLVAFLLTLDE